MGAESYSRQESSFTSSGQSSTLEASIPHHSSKPKTSRFRAISSSRVLGIPKFLIWIVLLIIVIAIVVPLAVMFGKKDKMQPHSDVLVPLYVYPSPGAWDPLYTAASTYPKVNFIAVVNPANGPGAGAGPDGNYTREIPTLNSYANIRTVGYVSTNWAKRDLPLVLQDINRYSAWSENSTIEDLGMHGIFLDETPAQYDDASAQFLQTIESAIVSAPGLGSHPLIIHNPGTIPDARYLSSCNLTIVFEGTYATYQGHGMHKVISAFRASSGAPREAFACIVHDMPMSADDEKNLVKDLKSVAGSVFVTGLDVDYYSRFWDGWLGFVGAMEA
ncbi:Spherulation-specific family 4-domain-containing protein [Xylogone sp. PMI_703]|nr:Spherulation-specific family 4-domain-containing protein [Xylogone sp. PMI_703]